MDYMTCYCRSPKCPMYGQVAPRAHVKMHDWQRQGPRFRCERCGVVVSATTGTAYVGIRTGLNTYLSGATALAEGLSIRATGRLVRVDKDTVNHWLPVLGQPCQGVMPYFFRNLPLHECHWMSCGHASTRRKATSPRGRNWLKSTGMPGAGWPSAQWTKWCSPGWWGSAPCARHAACWFG